MISQALRNLVANPRGRRFTAPGHRYAAGALLAIALGIAGGALFATPAGRDLEGDVGLGWLFRLRGPIAPPHGTVVLAMNVRSADALGVDERDGRWPRALHARLVDRLAAAGVGAIAFDVLFRDNLDDAVDRSLGAALRRAGNGVLLEKVENDTGPDAGAAQRWVAEMKVSPIPAVADGAAGVAPFPLPKVPVAVRQFWAFKETAGRVTPTLPVEVLSLLALQKRDRWARASSCAGRPAAAALAAYRASPRRPDDLRAYLGALRNRFADRPGLSRHCVAGLGGLGLASGERRLFAAVFRVLAGPGSYYLNFYGPPRTVRTIPYDRFLARGPAEDVRDKAVFVGESDPSRVNNKDGFYTVYTGADGIDLSGVEIVATAFANLLHNQVLRPLPGALGLGVVVAFGSAVTFLAFALAGYRGVLAGLAVAAGLLGAAVVAFATARTWLPIATPLLVQLPAGVLSGVLLQYLMTRRERENLRRGFGYFVSEGVVRDISRSGAPAAADAPASGVLLVTDIEGYTAMSEPMAPSHVFALTQEYYRLVGQPVEARGGHVLRYTGDGAICGWDLDGSGADAARRREACLAALDIARAMGAYNRARPERALPTGIGLHEGTFVKGVIGGGDHYEDSIAGDAVNTVARIQSANRLLGTRVLASERVARGHEGVLTRCLGAFRLLGKSEAVTLYEIVGRTAECDAASVELCQRFDDARRTYCDGRRAEAAAAFAALLARFPGDEPSKLYRGLCAAARSTADDVRAPVFDLKAK